MNREIILDLMGWRKNIFISQEDFVQGEALIKIFPPLNAMLPRDQIPEKQEYVEICFIKDSINNKGISIFKFK